MHFTLISEASLCKEDRYRINKKKNKCIIYKNGVTCRTIIVNNKLYQIVTHHQCPCINLLMIKQLHEKLGHLNYQYLQQILKDTPEIITEKIIDNNKQSCTKCLEANILRKIIPKTQQTKLANNFSKHLHIDIWGPAPITGYSRIKYLLTIVDNAT